MSQISFFPEAKAADSRDKYSRGVKSPIYAPRSQAPPLFALCDRSVYARLIAEIDNAQGVTDEEKDFLRLAAARHLVFHYERIADFYASASPECQELMEASALVVLDFEDAIERGFVTLCEEVRGQYLSDKRGD
jgi:hypothetical protein